MSSPRSIVSFCTMMSPSSVSAMVNGSSFSVGSGAAAVFGSSIGTPTVRSGAATMKMISSTSITSTIGVTLISAIGRWRPPAAAPRGRRPGGSPPCQAARSSCRDRIIENSSANPS